MSPRLVEELDSRYGVGRAFGTAYLDAITQPWARQGGRTFTSVAELLALPAPDSVWIDYALSTNLRGREVRDLILGLPQLVRSPRRVLDVGCGFGGLLAAFADRGCEIRGIEIDPQRVGFARANCRDRGVQRADDLITAGDVLDPAFVAGLGRFDVITAIDVIEHVLDVPHTIANLARLLNPGGLVFLEIPNRHSLRFVARDGHFNLFGITLLDRADAFAYQQNVLPLVPYDMGDYFELDEYARQFRSLGCSFALVDVTPGHTTAADAPALMQEVRAAFDRYLAETRPRLPALLDAPLQVRVADYLSTVANDYRGLLEGKLDREAFTNRYLVDFWRVAAVKP